MARKPSSAPPPAGLAFTIEHGPFLAALSAVAKVVSSKITIPVISHLLIRAELGGPVVITGTDLDRSFTAEVPAEVRGAGVVTIEAARLRDIVKKLPASEPVGLDYDPATRSSVVSSRRARFKLPGYPVEDFPLTPEPPGGFAYVFEAAGSILADMIAKTSFAISLEETRYYLNGIYCHVVTDAEGHKLRFVATDGHRLARIETHRVTGLDPAAPGIIIPTRSVDVLARLAEAAGDAPVRIEVSRPLLRVSVGSNVLTSKLIDGTFPDYERVIPLNNERPMTAPTLALAEAAERVSILSNEKGRGIKLQIGDDKVILSLRNDDSGSATDEVDVEFDGEPMEIGFNARYFAEILSIIGGDTIRLRFGADSTAPVLALRREDDGALYVLMPMRI